MLSKQSGQKSVSLAHMEPWSGPPGRPGGLEKTYITTVVSIEFSPLCTIELTNIHGLGAKHCWTYIVINKVIIIV